MGDDVQIFEMKQLPQNDVVPMQMLQRGVALWGGHRNEEGRTVLQRVRDGYPSTHCAIYAEACLLGKLVLSRNWPRTKGHSVIRAPPHHQNSVGTCCVQCVAQ